MTSHLDFKHALCVCVPLCVLTSLLLTSPGLAADRPNVIVIMAGDIGAHRRQRHTQEHHQQAIQYEHQGSMTEAGGRVPLLACWPGRVQPAVRDEFFCLVDVLPTIHSITGIERNRKVDGMDLSHLLIGGKGTNCERIAIQ